MPPEDSDGPITAMQQWALELLDRNPAAMLLVDGCEQVVYANRSAARLCSRGDCICLSPAGLTLHRKQDDDRLRSMLAAARSTARPPGGTMRVVRSSGKRPYLMVITPVAKRHRGLSRLRPAVWIIISDPDGDMPLPSDRLRAAFGLTEAEARLAALLGAGEELRSAAGKLGITYGTARARLAGIFEKTHTRRQGELIKVLLTTVAALG